MEYMFQQAYWKTILFCYKNFNYLAYDAGQEFHNKEQEL